MMTNESPCIVVLDDDPTGTQTVHDVPVLTCWAREDLVAALREAQLFYILTNSRALTAQESKQLHTELLTNLLAAAKSAGRRIDIVSRSDSTLRGHYPLECDVILDALSSHGDTLDGTMIVPCFPEGGRVTVDDVHYATIEGKRIPLGETEFARDRSFGFHSSNLRDWVEEKTGGRIKAGDVASLSLSLIRDGGAKAIADKLNALPTGAEIAVNSENYDDLRLTVEGIRQSGKRYLYRSAASLVKVLAGITDQPLLRGEELQDPKGSGGLVMVGSHTAKTTSQLEELLKLPGVKGIEFRVAEILNGDVDGEIDRVLAELENCLDAGKTAAVFTSRELQTATTGKSESNLSLSVNVSRALVSIVQHLKITPRFLIAKGGITSSDIATAGLGIRRATVLGQALPGVPVWRCGTETRFPGLPYVIFPGNVGDADALQTIVAQISKAEKKI